MCWIQSHFPILPSLANVLIQLAQGQLDYTSLLCPRRLIILNFLNNNSLLYMAVFSLKACNNFTYFSSKVLFSPSVLGHKFLS